MGQHLVTHHPCDWSNFRDPFDPWPMTHRPIPCSASNLTYFFTYGNNQLSYRTDRPRDACCTFPCKKLRKFVADFIDVQLYLRNGKVAFWATVWCNKCMLYRELSGPPVVDFLFVITELFASSYGWGITSGNLLQSAFWSESRSFSATVDLADYMKNIKMLCSNHERYV